MAIFRIQISSVGRSAGRRATAAAAYRAGERLRDERSGELFNYSRRRDVLHTEIFLPAHVESVAGAWAADRGKLWNAAEHAEKRHNSRVAREYQVALPPELSSAQRIALARAFSRELAERYKVAVDLAVHEPRPDGDPRNFHAHLLTTTREVTPAGLGAKTGLDMSFRDRRRHQLPAAPQEFVILRERWATLTNQALREAQVDARVEHRSLAARGIDREPRPSIPLVALKIERRGVRSFVAERLRAEYQARVQRRLARQAGKSAAQLPAPTPPATLPVALPAPRLPAPAALLAPPEQSTGSERSPETGSEGRAQTLEELRRAAREAWLRMRSESTHEAGIDRERERKTTAARSAEDDLGL